MINVLIVDDDNIKFGRIRSALIKAGVAAEQIDHSISAADTLPKLKLTKFDLVLLDVNLPLRDGEQPRRGGGLKLLSDLHREPGVMVPRYIVGVTACEDVVVEFGDQFSDQLWTLILYKENSDYWFSQIATKIDYIRASKLSDHFSDGKTYGIDLGIVCALEGAEFSAVKELPCEWQPLRFDQDETRYWSGSIRRGDKTFSILAAAAPRMGMPASSVLASKIIAQFRPRYLAMVGICAGRAEKTGIGDVIVADPCWDWGSGKIDSIKNKPVFKPSPHQIELDADLAATLKEICGDVGELARIKQRARGKKPSHELRVHFGPLASGAAVVANREIFETLLNQHRNLLGLEMEAYGIAVACKGSGKPRPIPLIMKSVCDYADKDKDDDYQEYAAHTSALLLYHAASSFL